MVLRGSDERKQLSGMLKKGQVLSADLRDSRGSMLLAAGLPVTEGLIRQLAEQGVHEVYLDDSPGDALASPLQVPYDSFMQQTLQHNFEQLNESLGELFSSAHAGQSTSTDELEGVVTDYLQATLKDTGVVLASCMQLESNRMNPLDEELQRRSVRMAILATITSHKMALPEADCINAGIVGALHDIALYGRSSLEIDDSYFEHPLRSIDLLKNTFGLTDQMRMMVGQVHEQCDGSGYPRRLKAARLHVVSRVLNVVDAFLTLIEPTKCNLLRLLQPMRWLISCSSRCLDTLTVNVCRLLFRRRAFIR